MTPLSAKFSTVGLMAVIAALGVSVARSAEAIVEVIADPAEIQLKGPGAEFLLLIQGKTKQGRAVDLTHQAKVISAEPGVARISSDGFIQSRGDGSTQLTIEVAGRTLKVPVVVSGTQSTPHYNFARDIEPILSRFGCNGSGCHGKAEGQNGFKLSVFGFDPRTDYQSLIMEGRGRRIFPGEPARSLLLKKAAGEVPHGGGNRLQVGTQQYETLRGWIAAGAPYGEPTDPTIESIELSPDSRIAAMGSRQQLRVVATYTDGQRVDVTRLAQFQSNSDALVAVDAQGLVTVGNLPGQAAVMASFRGEVDTFEVLVPREDEVARHALSGQEGFIDRLIYQRLEKLNIAPSQSVSDAGFLRRAFLDIIGTLPTREEAQDFLNDSRDDRRARLVDELLERPEYADYWALKWADLLKVDRQTLGHKGAYAYYKWIRDSIAENQPFDEMVRALIAAEGPLSESPQGHFYKVVRKPGEMASTLSQVFLGIRITCAECHHHPYDRWSQQDFYGMQAYFQQVRFKNSNALYAEGNPAAKHPRTGAPIFPYALGTQMPSAAPDGDRRRVLAEQFTSPDNPWFARNLANRMFAHFLGRGLVEPVDDVRDTNPPSNPELLSALASEFAKHDFDVKHLIRTITASQAYQRSTEPNATNLEDEQNYSRALMKPLSAEVLVDAVSQVTGVEEKFAGAPAGVRAIQLWDSRVPHYFLKLFGRPMRLTSCECERSAEPNVAQVLHLMNSPAINAKLSHDGGVVARLEQEHPADVQLAEAIYLTYFSRRPTAEELQTASQHFRTASQGRRKAAEDLAWSLLNTLEFVFNH